MAIRKSKINIDTEERCDFDNMMNDVENEVEEQQAEDGLVNRVPELKQLSEDIDKATNTFINATLELESAIQQYQRAEVQLGGAVTTISQKQIHIREVNSMFADERKKVRERYKEYDGCYLGHYAQWFFWFFFTIGIFVVAGGVGMIIAQNYI